MKKLFKIYNQHKYVSFLFFILPIFSLLYLNVFAGPDLWFLFSHGKYVINNGFPHVDFLSMHGGLHFVMQQWLSAVIFYLIHSIFGKNGLVLMCVIFICLYLFIIYKLCMLLSDNKFLLSIILSVITVLCLETNFILIRPQLFTYLFLFITLYIMELFYKNRNSKVIYFLILISFLQINFHSALFFMIYIFMLPYIVCLFIDFIKKKDKSIFKVLLVMLLMFIVSFINPYKMEAITYIFKSYGRSDFSSFILELLPPTITSKSFVSIVFYIMLISMCLIYIYYKKGVLELRHLFLFLGTLVLALLNIRNIALFFIGTIPFLSNYLKYSFSDKYYDSFKDVFFAYILFIIAFIVCFLLNGLSDSFFIEDGVDYLLKNYDKNNIVLYADFNIGSYCEYRGLHPYIDSRAEVYFKSVNKKYDYFSEYYLMSNGLSDYKEFLNRYNFSHLIVENSERLYTYLLSDCDYEMVYSKDKYSIFVKK